MLERSRRVCGVGVVLMALVGCGPDSATLPDDALVDEGTELVESELSADAMFAFLNGPEATFEVLRDEVGLDTRVADGIVLHVRGADQKLGTGDDDLISSLKELDGIAWVGPAAMASIDRFVTARGGTSGRSNAGGHFPRQARGRLQEKIRRGAPVGFPLLAQF